MACFSFTMDINRITKASLKVHSQLPEKSWIYVNIRQWKKLKINNSASNLNNENFTQIFPKLNNQKPPVFCTCQIINL